ncbi:MAG: acetylxylan esterase [Pirellulaceae bacterium]
MLAKRTSLLVVFVTFLSGPMRQPSHVLAQVNEKSELATMIASMSSAVLSDDQKARFADQTWRNLRARGDMVNRRDVTNWRGIESRDAWDRMREQCVKRLRLALGTFPERRVDLNVRITGSIKGDGYLIENLVYRTRPGFWVTANLYSPARPPKSMPGILIVHSHHRPKTQGELQDMGMTWARSGCLVLVIDMVGHGERGEHPFRGERDYKKKDSNYRWWRQDYYFRFDSNVQLHLTGESLMGWMVWDLMCGVDLLLSRPGIDEKRLIILGAVAGGGDIAAVTAALDQRIDAAVPFNFGGPQPETRFPLPEDAELRFNYLGGAYWEGTRNLRRTAVDGFLHWAIVASIAPRGLIYAHEFSWDRDRDPVWKRLNRIYEVYDAEQQIDFTLGRGSVRGSPPESSHCTNIGPEHRLRIHQAFNRWFDIHVTAEDEYSGRREVDELRSMTGAARRELKPKSVREILTNDVQANLVAVRKRRHGDSPADRRKEIRADWSLLLGDVQPRGEVEVLTLDTEYALRRSIVIERIALQVEADIVVPMILMYPRSGRKKQLPVVVAVAQSGKEQFLRERSDDIAQLLDRGATICIPDVRDAGTSRGSRGDGNGSMSYYALFFETPMIGYRLRDLRAVLQYLRRRDDMHQKFALWGDSFTEPNARETDFQVPKRVSGRPRFSEPLGGLLAMLAGLFEDDVSAVYVHGGLSSYSNVLASSYVYIPHDVVLPGVLTRSDLADLAASLAPRRLRLDGVVDGLNRTLTLDDVRSIYEPASKSYRTVSPASLSFTIDQADVAQWLLSPHASD